MTEDLIARVGFISKGLAEEVKQALREQLKEIEEFEAKVCGLKNEWEGRIREAECIVPEGYQLAPKEPTEAMCRALELPSTTLIIRPGESPKIMEEIYKAMLEACEAER